MCTEANSPSAVITGIGSWVPEKVLTNDALTQLVETSDEWITTRTGIRERRIASADEPCSELAIRAASAALASAGVAADSIELCIVATITADFSTPSTACLIQPRLGLTQAMCFDLSAACSGFVYAMTVARDAIESGRVKRALVIGAEKMSSIIDWKDRTTCVIFGDGAGAVVLEAQESAATSAPEQKRGILSSVMGADGEFARLIRVEAGGSALPASAETVEKRQHYLRMEGNQVFKSAVRGMVEIAKQALEQAGLTIDQIACVVPHQANSRIIQAIAEKLGLPMEKVVMNLDRYGNTTAASIPLALDEAVQMRRIRPGDAVLLVAFGAGLTWGALVLRW